MEYNCPACAREFKGISDYPLVYIVKFERVKIPSGLVLPDNNHEMYVDPGSPGCNKRPPEEVIDFFKSNSESSDFDFKDCIWRRKESLHTQYYAMQKKNVIDFIVKQLCPYFDTLDSLVGKEMPTAEVLPRLNIVSHGHYRIPDTTYDLHLHELVGHGEDMLRQDNVVVPNLETSHPARKLAFVIGHSDIGSTSGSSYVATLAGLAYCGRVRK